MGDLSDAQARIFLAGSPEDALQAPSFMVPVLSADFGNYRSDENPLTDDEITEWLAGVVGRFRAHFGKVEAWADCRNPTFFSDADRLVRELSLDGAWGQCENAGEFDNALAEGAMRMVGQLAGLRQDQRDRIKADGVHIAFELYRNVMPWQVPDYKDCGDGVGGNCIACYASTSEGATYTPVSEYISLGYYQAKRDSVYGVGLQPEDWQALGGGAPPSPPPDGEDVSTDEWWEQGYPGGPMVKVKGFPRPLYPPDAAAHGKTPSVDGPDVLAYKRTISRAGRWPWGTFDDTFSNGFSHGKAGGNVGDSGVAGIQRQQHLDATGWVGEKTFNALRSIRIPDGLPHAGEPAMDATAVKQINQAFDRFHGSEPPPVAQGTVRGQALDRAVSQLGTKESPPESNNVKYGSWYGQNYQPWCAMFVTWCYEYGAADLGLDSPSFVKGSRYAYCPYVVDDARNRRYGLATTDDPIPGDLVVYDWAGDGAYDHIGIFEEWTSGTSQFNAIEGNTSLNNNSNGGEVMRRSRSRGGQGTVFVRVAEP